MTVKNKIKNELCLLFLDESGHHGLRKINQLSNMVPEQIILMIFHFLSLWKEVFFILITLNATILV